MITNLTPASDMEYRGLSTDTKPTAVCNGAVFLEMDTGKVFMYDKTNSQWREL